MKLQSNSVLQVPFENYEKDFTFIVNSEKFDISTFQADLLSPTISKIHFNDPTIKTFFINTDTKGDFQHILNLLKFEREEIAEEEIPYIVEIIEILGIERLDLNINNDEEINISNLLTLIQKHQTQPTIYSTQLDKEVEFFTSHFHELKEEIIKSIEEGRIEIDENVIDRVLQNPKLQLDTEDELLNFVNTLYKIDSKYSELYKYVDFIYVESSSIKEFYELFDFNDLTAPVWESIFCRLEKEIRTNEKENSERKHEQVKRPPTFLTKIENKEKEFDGILNYLRTHGNIKNEINITYSSNNGNKDPFEIVKYEDSSTSSYFVTKNEKNSWICIEFKNHSVIPSGYIIRSYNSTNHHHLKTWILEGSNDNNSWQILDSQRDNGFLNGASNVHLFPITNNETQKNSYKYLRIKQTGQDWHGCNYLLFNSIEFYGQII